MSTISKLSGRGENGVRAMRSARKHLLRGLAAQIRMLPPEMFKLRGRLGVLHLKLNVIARNSRTTGAYKHAAFEAARIAAAGEAAA